MTTDATAAPVDEVETAYLAWLDEIHANASTSTRNAFKAGWDANTSQVSEDPPDRNR